MRLTKRQYRDLKHVPRDGPPLVPVHAVTTPTARNSLCRCGSGRKFKRCHGRVIMARLRSEPGQDGLVAFNIGPREYNR